MPGSVISDQNSKGIVNVLALGSFVRDLGQYIVWVIMSIYLNEIRSVGYVDIGLIFLIGGFISVPVSIYGGNLIDRIGRRRVALSIPWILMAMYAAMLLLIQGNYQTYLIVALFIALTPVQSVQYVTFDSIVSDVTTPQVRITAFSLLRIASNVGIGVGLVSGGIISLFNYSYVFVLPAAGSAVEGILYFLKIPETSRNVLEREEELPVKKKIKIPVGDKLFVVISLTVAAGWFFSGMFESPLTPLYLSSVLNYSNLAITGLFAVNTAVVIFAQTPLNRIMEKVKDSNRIIMGLFLFAIAYLVFAYTHSYPVLVLAVILLTIGENAGAPASTALITKIAPEESRGAYLGLYSSFNSLIGPFRPLVATALLSYFLFSPPLAWDVISFVSFAFCVVLYGVFRVSIARIEKRGSA